MRAVTCVLFSGIVLLACGEVRGKRRNRVLLHVDVDYTHLDPDGNVHSDFGLHKAIGTGQHSSDDLKCASLCLLDFLHGILGVYVLVIIGAHFSRREISKTTVGAFGVV